MTANDGFERIVATWLRDDAARSFPDQLEAVLARTVETRQRAWWSSPERWLPMHTTLTRRMAPAFRPVWLLIVVALVAIALVATIVITGANRNSLLPFGPALTGLVAYDEAGDLFVLDPVTKTTTALISGADLDVAPFFSPDGTAVAFGRQAAEDSTSYQMMVANADGTDVRSVTPPLRGIESAAWSGDGRYLAVAAYDRTTPADEDRQITVADVQRGTVEVLDLDMSAESVRALPPLGQEFVFRGSSALPAAIWAVRADGSGLRPLTARDGPPEGGYSAPNVSPDGRLLAWTTWEVTVHVAHVRDLSNGTTWVIPPLGAQYDDRHYPVFSPDGRQLLLLRHQRDGPPPDFDGFNQLVLTPVDGSDPGITLGPRLPDLEESEPVFVFSADGSDVLLLDRLTDTLWTLPADGSPGSSERWLSDWLPAHQRVAVIDASVASTPCPGICGG